jgi:exopolysaccharide biosynthesis protein
VQGTPRSLGENDSTIQAAINGVYYGADDGKPQGSVFIDGVQYATKKGLVSGYFVLNEKGAFVQEDLSDMQVDHIGTHPILLKDGLVHQQAQDPRYARLSNRSAIGTKTGNEVCFALTESSISMPEWAELLQVKGYAHSMNLDGGGESQLYVKDRGSFGLGIEATPLIFFVR